MGDNKFDKSSFDDVECLEIDETNQMIPKSFDIEENHKKSIRGVNEESQIGNGNEIKLEWSNTYKTSNIQLNGSSIKSIENESRNHDVNIESYHAFISSSNSIPQEQSDIYFDVKVLESGEGSTLFGLTKSLAPQHGNVQLWSEGTIYYSSNGSTFYDGNKYGKIEIPYSSGDILSCRIRRFKVDDILYTICQFENNGIEIGNPHYIDGTTLYPTIAIDSPGTIIEASLRRNHTLSDQKVNVEENVQNCKYAKPKLKYIWWIISVIVFPYFFYKGQASRWARPQHAKLAIVAFVSYFIMPLVDVALDLLNGVNYFPEDPKFGFYTILVAFLPACAKAISESVHIWRTFRMDVNTYAPITKDVLCTSLKNVFQQLPLVQAFVNLPQIVQLTSCKDTSNKAELITLKMISHSNWEAFMEGCPQLVLQLYILIETRKPTTFVMLSIISSCTSISIASSSTFLSDRMDHPIGCRSLVAKLVLAPIFFLLFFPRALFFATITLLLKNNSKGMVYLEVYALMIFIGTFLLLLYLLLKLLMSEDSPKKYIWMPEQGNEYGVKGMYRKEIIRGFSNYRSELQLKATFLSIFVPCIVIKHGSRALKLTSGFTSLWYILGITCGWILFGIFPRLFNDSVLSHEWMPVLFPLIISLSVFQLVATYVLCRVSNHLILHRYLRGNFNHISLIGILLDNAAKREYDIEQLAKESKYSWRSRLANARSEHSKKEGTNNLKEIFSRLCKTEIDLRESVIIARKSNKQFVTITPHVLMKNIRLSDDILSDFVINVKENEKQDNDLSPLINHPKMIDNTVLNMVKHGTSGKIYSAIQNSTNIDETNTEGNTALMIGVQNGSLEATKLMLNAGASVLQKNNESLTAFDLSLKQKNDEIKLSLWNHIKKEKAHKLFFFQLCERENIEGVKYCMEHSNDEVKQSMIEFIHDAYEEFPWYHITKNGKDGELSDYLFSQHEKLNPSFLKQCDKYEYDPMINAAKEGHLEIVRKLIPKYRKNNHVEGTKKDGLNALIMASCNGHEEIVRLLLPTYEEDGKVDEKDILGRSALDYATMYGHTNVIKLLTKDESESNDV